MARRKIPDNVKRIRGTFTPSGALGDHLEFDLVTDVPAAPLLARFGGFLRPLNSRLGL